MFDPYHKWLGIAPKDQPPNHYRLLGIDLFEADNDVIDSAADRLMAWLQEFATGPQVAESQKLLNEIAAARVCLLNAEKKAAYDLELSKTISPQTPAAKAAKPRSEAATPRTQTVSETAPAREPSRNPSSSGINRSPSNSGINRSPSNSGINRSPSNSGINRSPSSSGINRQSPATPSDDVKPQRTPKTPRQLPKTKESPKSSAATTSAGKERLAAKRAKRNPIPPIAVIIPLGLLGVLSVVLIGAWFMNQPPVKPAGRAKPTKKSLASSQSKRATPSATNSQPRSSDSPPQSQTKTPAPSFPPARSPETNEKTSLETRPAEVPLLPEPPEMKNPPAAALAGSPLVDPASKPVPTANLSGEPANPAPPNPPRPAVPPGQVSSSTTPTDRRFPLPTSEQQEKASGLLKEFLTQDAGSSKKRESQKDISQKEVVQKLLAMAETMTTDSVSCFVLARGAHDRAVELVDLPLMDRTVDFLTARFQVSEFELKAECFEMLALKPQKIEVTRNLADRALALEDRALSADDFSIAERLVKVGQSLAKKTPDADLKKEATARAKELPNIQQQWETAQAAIATLAKNADDADARLALGRYLCFIRANWEEGLPHLANGSDPVLKELARSCQDDATDPAVLVERGDAWRKQAIGAKGAANRAELMSGARYWYARAVPWMTGLPKAVAEKHMVEAGAAAAGSRAGASLTNRRPPPLATCPFDAEAAKKRQRQWSQHLNALPRGINSVGIPLVLIPPGEFQMGTSAEEAKQLAAAEKSSKWSVLYANEVPRHRVIISKPFYIGQFEVTFEQFGRFVNATGYKTTAETNGRGGSGHENDPARDYATSKPYFSWRNTGRKQAPDDPVGNVSWLDAKAFCEWLSAQERVTYRLPTEAEWEYACRAGTSTRFPFGDDDKRFKELAWSWWELNPVGKKPPNAFGLFDMVGNANEWCGDLFQPDYYLHSPVNDPPGPASDGTSIANNAYVVKGVLPPPGHSAGRDSAKNEDVNLTRGFRIVRELPGR